MRMTVIRRERLKPLQARTTLMRTAAMLLVLMLVSPVAAAIVDDQELQINLEIDGEPILPTYSLAVQLAFDRVEELDQYSEDQLAETDECLTNFVTSHFGEKIDACGHCDRCRGNSPEPARRRPRH